MPLSGERLTRSQRARQCRRLADQVVCDVQLRVPCGSSLRWELNVAVRWIVPDALLPRIEPEMVVRIDRVGVAKLALNLPLVTLIRLYVARATNVPVLGQLKTVWNENALTCVLLARNVSLCPSEVLPAKA